MAELAREQRAEMRKLVSNLTVKADKIRALDRAGYQRSAIAKFLGLRYQHVRNVLVRAQEKRASGASVPPKREWVSIGPDGRLVVPAAYRRTLGIEGGGQVLLTIDGDEVRLAGRDAAVRRAQGLVKAYVPAGTRLSDELIAERRAEAARESADASHGS